MYQGVIPSQAQNHKLLVTPHISVSSRDLANCLWFTDEARLLSLTIGVQML